MHMKRLPLIALTAATLLALYGCGLTTEAEPDEDEETTPAPGETLVEQETDDTTTTTTLAETAGDSGAAGDAESEITGVDSGVFEGEAWIKLNFAGPIVVDEERKRYSLEFRTNEDDLIVAAYNVEPGGDQFSTSFCIGETPSCPDGVFPIVGVPTETNDAIVFNFATDAFSNSTDPSYKAFVETGPADSPEDRTTVDFQGGERFSLLTVEKDPC